MSNGKDSPLVLALREHAKQIADRELATLADDLGSAMDADALGRNETTKAAVREASTRARKRWDQLTAAGVMTIQVEPQSQGDD